VDQRLFVDRAVAALDDLQPLRAECEAALASTVPAVPILDGMASFTPNPDAPTMLANGVNVTFNASGAIVALVRGRVGAGSGRQFADGTSPLGLFSYAKHSGAVLDHWGSTCVCHIHCGWVN
jgi:hypothetical protein